MQTKFLQIVLLGACVACILGGATCQVWGSYVLEIPAGTISPDGSYVLEIPAGTPVPNELGGGTFMGAFIDGPGMANVSGWYTPPGGTTESYFNTGPIDPI